MNISNQIKQRESSHNRLTWWILLCIQIIIIRIKRSTTSLLILIVFIGITPSSEWGCKFSTPSFYQRLENFIFCGWKNWSIISNLSQSWSIIQCVPLARDPWTRAPTKALNSHMQLLRWGLSAKLLHMNFSVHGFRYTLHGTTKNKGNTYLDQFVDQPISSPCLVGSRRPLYHTWGRWSFITFVLLCILQHCCWGQSTTSHRQNPDSKQRPAQLDVIHTVEQDQKHSCCYGEKDKFSYAQIQIISSSGRM